MWGPGAGLAEGTGPSPGTPLAAMGGLVTCCSAGGSHPESRAKFNPGA